MQEQGFGCRQSDARVQPLTPCKKQLSTVGAGSGSEDKARRSKKVIVGSWLVNALDKLKDKSRINKMLINKL